MSQLSDTGLHVGAKSLWMCLTLCDPMDYNSPGSSVHGIFQSRILEWVGISSSMGSSQPRDQTWVSALQVGSLSSELAGSQKRVESSLTLKPYFVYLCRLSETLVGGERVEKDESGGRLKLYFYSSISHHPACTLNLQENYI